jgi:hypothetical protein
MAVPGTMYDHPIYANKSVVMLSEAVRMILIDSRQNVGRVAATETVVAEFVMTRNNAEVFANAILDILQVNAEAKE